MIFLKKKFRSDGKCVHRCVVRTSVVFHPESLRTEFFLSIKRISATMQGNPVRTTLIYIGCQRNFITRGTHF